MAKKKTTRKRRIQPYLLYIEDRVVHTINDVEILGPTLKQALEAVRRLNGKNTTNIIVDLGSKHLTIGGGNEGRYIAFLTQIKAGEETFFNLLSSRAPAEANKEELGVIAGRQYGLYPRRQVVDLKTVVLAARHFAQYGTRCPSLISEKQR
jgi:hypothetical protein